MKVFIALTLIASVSAFAQRNFQAERAKVSRELPAWARANCHGCKIVHPFTDDTQVELKIPYGRTHLQAQVLKLSDDKITLFAPHFGNDQFSAKNIYDPSRARDGVRAEVDRLCKKFGPNWHVVDRQDGIVSTGQLSEEHWKEYHSLHQLECRKGLPSWNSFIVMAGQVSDAITAPFVNDSDRSTGKEVSRPLRNSAGRPSSQVRGQ